jgi:hypothetical protein
MKKLLVFWLVLAAAGGLSAQELKWSGGVHTGLGVSSDENAGVDIWNDDSYEGDYGLGLGFLKAEYTHGNAGASVRLHAEFSPEGESDYRIKDAAVWVNLLNDVLHVRAGRMDNGNKWGRASDDWSGYASGTGALLELKPAAGFSFGAVLKTELEAGYGEAPKAAANAEEFFKNTVFGASYFNPGLLYAAASIQLGGGGGGGTPNKAH